MAAPTFLVENKSDGIEGDSEELQAVLIDFGQSVDPRHPDAIELLSRDVDRVISFFSRQGVETIETIDALANIVEHDGDRVRTWLKDATNVDKLAQDSNGKI